mmetsp:Transcript_24881/g.67748  ORF Transcript_24881/g.67748 Transcript_24881/m.67748 type:complete len:233 (-) Transcript_24881:296-994(-)
MMISGGAAHAATSRPPNANSLPQRNIPAPLPRAAVCSSHTPQQPVAFSSSPCRHRRALRVYAAAEPPQAPDSTSPKQPQMGIPGLIPQDVKLEIKSEQESDDIEWNPETKTLRFPSVLGGSEPGARRTKLVVFTCDKCGGRTARNVNPIAWEKGFVMGQCAQCEVWHVLSSNDPKIYEEIRYNEPKNKAAYAGMAAAGTAAAATSATATTATATATERPPAASSNPINTHCI